MTNEEKQVLVNDLMAYIGQPLNSPMTRSQQMEVARIALAALTAQPVISDDTKRMDWLCAHCVEVRYPLMYGSREMFRAQQDSEEWDLPHHTTLREQVDAAIANEVEE